MCLLITYKPKQGKTQVVIYYVLEICLFFSHCFDFQTPVDQWQTSSKWFFWAALVLLTLVEGFGSLTGAATAIGATFHLSRAFLVMIAALHASRSKATGLLWMRTAALLHRQHKLKELTTGYTLPILPEKHPLEWLEGDKFNYFKFYFK